MPPCAGVALGLDRLLMIKTKKRQIKDVIAFPADIA
ncbi:MAG: amino acid--tRNA ligase-related protein [Coxiella endosymbiont of Dermacentor nuttalli]